MNNAELIKALRYCSDNEKEDGCDECQYLHNGMCRTMLSDAAYALEADEQRIAELMPKEGEWIVDKNGYPQIICSICDVHIPMVAGWCMDAHIKYCPNCGAKMKGANDGES